MFVQAFHFGQAWDTDPGHFVGESLPIGGGTKRANVVQVRYEPREASHLFLISLGDLTINHVIKSGLAADTTTNRVEFILHSTTLSPYIVCG